MLWQGAVRGLTQRTRQRARRPAAAAAPRYVDERPGCAFGLATRRGMDDLAKDFDRLETKVNGLLCGVAITLLVELWRSWR